MNSRERFLAAINGLDCDRPPIVGNLTIQLAENLAQEMSLPIEFIDSFLATRISHRQILLSLGNDAVVVAATRSKNSPTIILPNGNSLDEWGIEYEQVGFYSEAVHRPLSKCETIEDLNKYVFPDPLDDGRWEFAIDSIKEYKNKYGIIGDLEASIFELAWNLVGMEKFIMDLATNEEYIPVLLDKILDYTEKCGLKMISLGCDVIWTGDDIGTQIGLMLSPEMWREHFKPRMKKMFESFKNANQNIKIAYHSCGAISELIPDFIEIGLDILNPLQPLATGMNLSEIYNKYHNELVFFGGICVQELLPKGSEEDIASAVKNCIKATNGGKKFIIAPAHNIQPDTPTKNVYAFYKFAKEI